MSSFGPKSTTSDYGRNTRTSRGSVNLLQTNPYQDSVRYSKRASLVQGVQNPYEMSSEHNSFPSKSRSSNVHSSVRPLRSRTSFTNGSANQPYSDQISAKPAPLRQPTRPHREEFELKDSVIETASKLSGPQPGESPVVLSPDLPTETLFALVLHARNHYAALGFIGNRVLSAFTIRSEVFPTFSEDQVSFQKSESSTIVGQSPQMPKVIPLDEQSDLLNKGSEKPSHSAKSDNGASKSESTAAKQNLPTITSRALLNLPHVTAKDVERRYRQLAVRVHPDKVLHPLAEKAFQRLNEAFAILRDDAKRLKYDASLDDYSVLLPFYRRGSLPLPLESQSLLENSKGDDCIRDAAYGLRVKDDYNQFDQESEVVSGDFMTYDGGITDGLNTLFMKKIDDGVSNDLRRDESEVEGSPRVNATVSPISELEAAYLNLCRETEAALPNLAPDPSAEARIAKFAMAARARQHSRNVAAAALKKAELEAKSFLDQQRQEHSDLFANAKAVVSGTYQRKGSLSRENSQPSIMRGGGCIASIDIQKTQNRPMSNSQKTHKPTSSVSSKGVSFGKLAHAYAPSPTIATRPNDMRRTSQAGSITSVHLNKKEFHVSTASVNSNLNVYKQQKQFTRIHTEKSFSPSTGIAPHNISNGKERKLPTQGVLYGGSPVYDFLLDGGASH